MYPTMIEITGIVYPVSDRNVALDRALRSMYRIDAAAVGAMPKPTIPIIASFDGVRALKSVKSNIGHERNAAMLTKPDATIRGGMSLP